MKNGVFLLATTVTFTFARFENVENLGSTNT